MATVKLKFRPSGKADRQGTLYYQVIHKRTARQIGTNHRIYPVEWDSGRSEIISPVLLQGDERLFAIRSAVEKDMERLRKIIYSLDGRGTGYTSDDVVLLYRHPNSAISLTSFMRELAVWLKSIGKTRISETYAASLNSFIRFNGGNDVLFDEISSNMMIEYEAFLKSSGVSPNTSSFYMRNLRAAYNRAVDKGLAVQNFPFRYVYTGIGKTVKRALPLKTIRRIKEIPLHPGADFARNMFLFSFYTRGMSFVDMSYLKKTDLKNGNLVYRRRKTGQRLVIRWESCMQDIVDKYDTGDSPYLLPIIRHSGMDERKQYLNMGHFVNRHLKNIGTRLNLDIMLTMYVSRHTWASAAKVKNIPTAVISEALGHGSEMTTRIYLASLDNGIVDDANRLILKEL